MKLFGLLPHTYTISVAVERRTASGESVVRMIPVTTTETRKRLSFPLTKDTLLAVRSSDFLQFVHRAVSKGQTLFINCGSWDGQTHSDNDFERLCEHAREQTRINPDFRFNDNDLMTILIGEAKDTLGKAGINCNTQIVRQGLFIVGEKETDSTSLDTIERQDLSFLSEGLSGFSEVDYNRLDSYFDDVFARLNKGQSVKISKQINKSPDQNFGMLIENGDLSNEVNLGFFPELNKEGSSIFLSALRYALDKNKRVTVCQPKSLGSRFYNVFSVEKDIAGDLDITVNDYSDINGSPDVYSFNYTKVFALVLHDLLKKNIVYLKIPRNKNFNPMSFEKYARGISSVIPLNVEVNFTDEPHQNLVTISPQD